MGPALLGSHPALVVSLPKHAKKPLQRQGARRLCFRVSASAAGKIIVVPPSERETGLRRIRQRWNEIQQYTPDNLELVLANDSFNYEQKVAWLARYYAMRPLEVGGRFAKVLAVGARCGITWVMEERLPASAPRKRGAVLRDGLSALGPVFVKIGQTLATRPDIIGEEAAEYLTQLQEKNSPFPSERAFRIIRDEFGWSGPIAGNHLDAINSPEEEPLFAELSEEPIAAASLGQVYKGRLPPSADGEPRFVAVKVMRPGVGRQIALDVHVIRLTLKWLQKYWGTEAELPNISNEVGAGLFRELDYHQEANNIEEFRHAHSFQKFLRIPQTFPEWTRQRVLCMEWIEGRRKGELGDAEKLSMVKMGVDTCMAQLLQTGIIHADPHDGNMMLAGKELCLLDFGLVTRITIEQQEAMASAILHTLAEEWAALVEDMKIMGLLPEVPAIWVDPVTRQPVSALEKGEWEEMPEEAFTDVFSKAMTGGGTQRSFSQITEQLCELAQSYRVNLPTWLVLIIRSMMTLDGFASAMNYNPIEAAYPHAIRRALAPVTVRGREALRNAILTPTGDVRWARLSNLLGNDDALRDAAAENMARAAQSTELVSTSSPGRSASEDLHMDAGEEAKRVVQELMLSPEGSALRRLIYTANTSSILSRVLAWDALRAGLEAAGGVQGVVKMAAGRIEERIAHAAATLITALKHSQAKDKDTRQRLSQASAHSWRAAAVYGVLARRHAKQMLSCGLRGVAAALGLTMAATLVGVAASLLAITNSLAKAAAAAGKFATRPLTKDQSDGMVVSPSMDSAGSQDGGSGTSALDILRPSTGSNDTRSWALRATMQ